jgi:hypothetical protein
VEGPEPQARLKPLTEAAIFLVGAGGGPGAGEGEVG